MKDLHALSVRAKKSASTAIYLAEKKKFAEALRENDGCIDLKKTLQDWVGVSLAYQRKMYIYLDLFKAETDSEEKESLAKQAYKMALNAWKYSPNNEQTKRQVAITADKWATFLSNKKDYATAETIILESIDFNLIKDNEVLDQLSFVYACRKLAFIYLYYAWQQDNLNDTLERYKKAYLYGKWGEEFGLKKGRDAALALLAKIGHEYAGHLERAGQVEKALYYLQENLVIHRERNDLEKEIITLDKIASIYFHQKNLKAAMELFEQVIKLKAKTNELGYDHSRHMLAQAHVQLAEFYQAEKLLDKAVMHYEQAITLSRLNLDTRKVSENYLHLAFVYAHQKQPKQAADCFYQGYTQYREIISLREGVDFYQQVDPLVVADLAKADEHYRTQNYHIAVGIYMACCDAIMTTSKQLLVAKTTHATVIKKMEQVGNGKGARKRPYEEEAPLVNETEEDCPLTKLQIAKEESYEVTNAYKN